MSYSTRFKEAVVMFVEKFLENPISTNCFNIARSVISSQGLEIDDCVDITYLETERLAEKLNKREPEISVIEFINFAWTLREVIFDLAQGE